MTVAERIKICMLLEEMDQSKEFSKELGLVNTSKYIQDEASYWSPKQDNKG